MAAPTASIVGFDSAWADNPKAPGAICAIRLGSGGRTAFIAPELVSFDGAVAFIARERAEAALCLVAIDQPTIVPNATGGRPVDRVAASLISWLGGGVQPANRSRLGLFDDAAPLWRFKDALGANDDAERARSVPSGLFLMEVFPALALPTLEAIYCGAKLGPRYNPDRRRTFRLEHWHGVRAAVARLARADELAGVAGWIEQAYTVGSPRKADQDRLDAVICALVGHHWLTKPRDDSIMIGDLDAGYMVAPASSAVRARLGAAARAWGVPVDGATPT